MHRKGFVVVAAFVALLALAPAAARAAYVNNSPLGVYVVTNNIENNALPSWPLVPDPETHLEACRADWRNLPVTMQQTANVPAPDFLVVQQVTDSWSLGWYAILLSSMLGTSYSSMTTSPGNWKTLPNNSCEGATANSYKLKETQLNGIVYRSDRFTPIGDPFTFPSYLTGCGEDPAIRTHNIAQRFTDNLTHKTVKVTSIHWPSGTKDQNLCDDWNAAVAAYYAGQQSDSLQIVAGDFNITQDKQNWWNTLANSKFRDAVMYGCGGNPTCVNANWTGTGDVVSRNNAYTGQKRRDFVWARRGNGLPPLMTAYTYPYAAYAQQYSAYGYSPHRAVGGFAYYDQ